MHMTTAVRWRYIWVYKQVPETDYQNVQLPLIAEGQKSEKRNQRASASAEISEHFPDVRNGVARQPWRNRTKNTSKYRSLIFYPSLRSQLTSWEASVQASSNDHRWAGARRLRMEASTVQRTKYCRECRAIGSSVQSPRATGCQNDIPLRAFIGSCIFTGESACNRECFLVARMHWRDLCGLGLRHVFWHVGIIWQLASLGFVAKKTEWLLYLCLTKHANSVSHRVTGVTYRVIHAVALQKVHLSIGGKSWQVLLDIDRALKKVNKPTDVGENAWIGAEVDTL